MAGQSKKNSPCKRSRKGIKVCLAMDMSLSDSRTGIQVMHILNLPTGKMTEYIGARRTAKERPILFNVCPFCEGDLRGPGQPK